MPRRASVPAAAPALPDTMTPLKSTLLPFLVVLATITTQVTTYASPLSYDARGLLAARSSVAFDVRTDTPAAPGNPPVAPTTGPHQLGHFLYDHDEVGRNVRLSYLRLSPLAESVLEKTRRLS